MLHYYIIYYYYHEVVKVLKFPECSLFTLFVEFLLFLIFQNGIIKFHGYTVEMPSVVEGG